MAEPAPDELPVVSCPEGTLVVGDVHLDLFDEGALEPFTAWLDGLSDAPRLVVLGDLFEFWVGRKQQRLAGAGRLLAALRRLVGRGTALDVLHGNRDFLLDRSFEEASGARVRPRGLIGEHGSHGRTLFLHGDELCTLDRAYRSFRRLVRSAPVRWLGLHLPFALQRRIAAGLRSRSRGTARRAGGGGGGPARRAQQGDAARRRLAAAGADTLVCGHAHDFRDDPLPGGRRWLVIDGWGGPRDALRLGPGGRWQPVAAGELGQGSRQGAGN